MDWLTCLASSIARDLVCGAVEGARYSCCLNDFVEDLQNEENKLIATRNSVQDRVKQDGKQTRKTAEVVLEWLKQANTHVDNVEELLKKARTNRSCCNGHCPNWISRYDLGKKLLERKNIIKTCIEEGRKYILITRLASLSGLAYFSSERCLKFESRKSADEELMEALKNDEVNMIGLYGMGGCGKTTLAMEVGKRAGYDIFNRVLFVALSHNVEVQKIQDKIADSLGLDLKEKEEMQRAERLSKRLILEEKVLVILDDVWQRLNFEAIGIPPSEKHKGCKVLITTRSEDICDLMGCQRKIYLADLTDDEAWDLFQKEAHLYEGTSNALEHLARQISDECKGLPVAIAAVASTLKGKSEAVWKVALDRLRHFKQVNIEKGVTNPYHCLHLSYDNLDNKEAKSIFLLCSVFPEGAEISIELLTRMAIGLGLVEEESSYEGKRDEVNAMISMLKRSCLLSDASGGECVKMHDLVYGVAHWIANDDIKVINCALEKNVTVKHCPIKYLWCEEFPKSIGLFKS